jgi:hypothetical protein
LTVDRAVEAVATERWAPIERIGTSAPERLRDPRWTVIVKVHGGVQVHVQVNVNATSSRS